LERPGSLVGLACDHCRRHDAAGHESDAGMPEALNLQRMRRGLGRLLLLAALVVVVIVTVPGLGSIRSRLAHGNPGWLVLAGCLRLASALSYVILFRAIFAPRMALRASYRIGMAEVGANALAPAGGASGLAIGDWVLHREGRTWSWLVERTAEFFVFTSAFNVGAVAALGWLGAAGVLTSGVSPFFSLAPAFAATVAIAVALALIPRLARLKDKQRRRRVHSWRWWLLELGVALGTGARGAVNLFRRGDRAAIAGGAGYLLFDILTLWATARAFGGDIGFQPLALAYLVGQLAGEIPIPGGLGAVDGGLIGALVAYGLSSSLAVASSLAYRAIALAIPVVFGGMAAISLTRGIRNQKAQTATPIAESLRPFTVRTNARIDPERDRVERRLMVRRLDDRARRSGQSDYRLSPARIHGVLALMKHSLGNRPHVVVVGGGFGGLQAALHLARLPVDITLIDRRNFHLFQPLVYQVATGALSPAEIAYPLRHIFRRHANVRVLLAEVTDVDLDARLVRLRDVAGQGPLEAVPYDMLIVSTGAQYNYFGHDSWRMPAPNLKTLEGALAVRRQILGAFEAAELEPDAGQRASWLTFVIVGAGPTGVEMAGQIAEIANDLRGEFRSLDSSKAQILLVETGDRVLQEFPPSLSARAERSLASLGVTTLTRHAVVDIDATSVTLDYGDGERREVSARTAVWAAGVVASPFAATLAARAGAKVDRAGHIEVLGDLSLPGHPEVMAVGDMIRIHRSDGSSTVLPGVAPVAMQEGRHAARAVRDRLRGRPCRAFRYRDKGNLATIGRARAIADIKGIHLSGFVAWVTWLTVHLFYLVGFANRLVVVIRWAFSFLARGRGARLITGESPPANVQDAVSRIPARPAQDDTRRDEAA
jgi:NADH:ubiquinone reductase (H+-translocating)